MPRRYQHCTLDNFLTYGNASLERALKRAPARRGVPRRRARAVPPRPAGSRQDASRRRRASSAWSATGARGIFLRHPRTAPHHPPHLRPVGAGDRDRSARPVMDADLLVLDDLGAEKTSEWVRGDAQPDRQHRYSERRPRCSRRTTKTSPTRPIRDSLLCRSAFRMRSRLHRDVRVPRPRRRRLSRAARQRRRRGARCGQLRKKPRRRALPPRSPGASRAARATGDTRSRRARPASGRAARPARPRAGRWQAKPAPRER